jgi:hypothetical protein
MAFMFYKSSALRSFFIALPTALVFSGLPNLNEAKASDHGFSMGINLEFDTLDDTPYIDDAPRATDNQHPAWFSETFLNLPEDLARARL